MMQVFSLDFPSRAHLGGHQMHDDMLDRFLRSCQLVKSSWDVLRSDRELLLLPVLSILAAVLALLIWVTLAQVIGINFPNAKSENVLQLAEEDPTLFGWIFLAYLLLYFIAFFFNTALVGAALAKLEGGDPTLSSALTLALQRIGPIFGYALVSATVGIIMATIVERVGGIIGRLIGFGLGFAWTVTTFLVVPILAAKGVGPIAAIEESASLLRKTWGENLIGSVGISFAMSVIATAILIVGVLGGIAASQQGYPALVVPILAGTAMLVAISALIGSALRGIYVAAVYYYAVAGEPPWGFERSALQSTFTQKDSG
jgi:Family of unknown function (DUF6159)